MAIANTDRVVHRLNHHRTCAGIHCIGKARDRMPSGSMAHATAVRSKTTLEMQSVLTSSHAIASALGSADTRRHAKDSPTLCHPALGDSGLTKRRNPPNCKANDPAMLLSNAIQPISTPPERDTHCASSGVQEPTVHIIHFVVRTTMYHTVRAPPFEPDRRPGCSARPGHGSGVCLARHCPTKPTGRARSATHLGCNGVSLYK